MEGSIAADLHLDIFGTARAQNEHIGVIDGRFPDVVHQAKVDSTKRMRSVPRIECMDEVCIRIPCVPA